MSVPSGTLQGAPTGSHFLHHPRPATLKPELSCYITHQVSAANLSTRNDASVQCTPLRTPITSTDSSYQSSTYRRTPHTRSYGDYTALEAVPCADLLHYSRSTTSSPDRPPYGLFRAKLRTSPCLCPTASGPFKELYRPRLSSTHVPIPNHPPARSPPPYSRPGSRRHFTKTQLPQPPVHLR